MPAKKPPMKKSPMKGGKKPMMGNLGGGGMKCPKCGTPMFGRGTKCYACGTGKK